MKIRPMMGMKYSFDARLEFARRLSAIFQSGLREAHSVLSEIFLGRGLRFNCAAATVKTYRVLPRCCPEGRVCQEAKNRAEIVESIQWVVGAPEEIRTPDP
jgi:hypothetical protein